MLIHQASAPEATGGFLHAGYTSAYNDFHADNYTTTGTTGVSQSPPTSAAVMPEANIVLVLLFFAGLALLRFAKGMPPAKRWAAMAIITCLTIFGLVYPALQFAGY